ncbi:synaptic vesicle membrane protein VAT-1 homolog-like isoform X2 [Limulus polyphemus]|uniref:Synaptic vesicle membrane protein VAT-1 homolog-like isoform X2 n=1 Tax=Limulus polyphemus TaxID=6850 RepID=A0ABM1BLZ4_LIMPO|nr:synaptic vesicle membrane protein VAT-1 homolog-like isoform X2 [Limulus polyphemus]
MSEPEAAGDNVNNEENNPPESKTENKNEEEQPEPPKEMKAVVLAGFGGLKSVKVMNKPQPAVGEGEILIRVKACGLNFLDVMVRQGVIDSPPKTPFILGFECAGEVEGVGEGVTDVKVGDRVAALTEYKAWAELVSVPAKYVYSLPQGMEFQNAASMLMNYVVAYILVFDIGNIRSGQSVLVHSAGGGVGQAISQLCKTVSDVTLIGTASKHKHESIKDSFAHLLDHGVDYVQEIKKLSPEGVDIVLDCLYGDDANKGYNLLKPLGRYILYGTSSIVTGETKSFFSFAKSWWQVDKINPMKLFDENRSVSGFQLRHLLYQQGAHEYVRGVVNKVFKMWENGHIKPVVDSTWAFEDVPEAMQKLHDRKNVGKIILDPNMEPKPKPKLQTKGSKDKDKEKEKDGKAVGETAAGESTDAEKENKEGDSSAPSSAN